MSVSRNAHCTHRYVTASIDLRCRVAAGYVPRSPFKFGKTYREECDICLAEFLAARDRVRQREREMLLMTRSSPNINHVPLQPHGPTWGSPQGGLSSVTDDQQVRDHLNSFRDRSFHSSGARQCFLAVVYLSILLLKPQVSVTLRYQPARSRR